MSEDKDNAITPDKVRKLIAGIHTFTEEDLCDLGIAREAIEQGMGASLLLGEAYLKLHEENQRLRDFMTTECPKGTTVRANKTYGDFHFEMASKQEEFKEEVERLQEIVDGQREALQFYGDRNNYNCIPDLATVLEQTANGGTVGFYMLPPVKQDEGNMARKALALTTTDTEQPK